MKPDDCVFFLLAKANQAGHKLWTKAMSKYGVTGVQGMVLNFLNEKDNITSKELGKRTTLDSATLTGILDRLEKAGLIIRGQHPNDRRAINVCLSEEGKRVVEKTYSEIEIANAAALKSLTAEEKNQFKILVKKVKTSLSAAYQDF